MKKIKHIIYLFLVMAGLAVAPAPAVAGNLGVVRVAQLTTDTNGNAIGYNWCWAASSKMIMDYYGYPNGLIPIVTYGIGSPTYDTWNYLWGSGSEVRSNVLVWTPVMHNGTNTGAFTNLSKTINPLSYKGIENIIKGFSGGEIQTKIYRRSLFPNESDGEINTNSAPFVVRIGWYNPTTGAPEGGHFVVCYGYTLGGDVLSIHDPWFGSYLKSGANMGSGTNLASGLGASNHRWTHTLTTSRLFDVVFLFDTTGSMGSSISDAKTHATDLLDVIAARYKNYRVAVANYKDLAQENGGPGDYGDYVYAVNQSFTTNKALVEAAINGLGTGGGRDTPESVYSALYNTIIGTGIGAWRPDPAKRLIILIGDAPGHDPEPWAGGHSFAEIVALATNSAISIHCLNVGTSIDAASQFGQLSGASGGASISAVAEGGTAAGLQQIIEAAAGDQRIPEGTSSQIYPTFQFNSSGDGGMGADASLIFLEIQKSNTVSHAWSRYRLVTIKDKTNTVYKAKFPLPQGQYRWRLGFKRPAQNIYLPAKEIGSSKMMSAAKTVFETSWTEFTRVSGAPSPVTIISPTGIDHPSGATVPYTFGTVPGATKYVIEIYQDDRLWRRYYLAAPAGTNPTTLTKTVIGHKASSYYYWRAQGLNQDRRAIDNSKWSRSF